MKMKTSNIIILVYLPLLLAGTIFLFADDKKNVDAHNRLQREKFEEKFVTETTEIPSYFSVIAGLPGSSFDIRPPKDSTIKTQLEAIFKVGDEKPDLQKLFKIQNDTLYIDKGVRVSILTKNVKSVTATNASSVNLNHKVKMEILTITTPKSKSSDTTIVANEIYLTVFCDSKNEESFVKIDDLSGKNLALKIKKCKFEALGLFYKTMDIDADNAEVNITNPDIRVMNIRLNNRSSLNANSTSKVGKINSESSGDSKYRINN
jgi:hypothetical protein